MRVLIVGAGAVGQTYGLHLRAGGANVSFFLKPQHLQAARRGFTLYPLHGRRHSERLEGCGLLTTPAEVAEHQWDQVWFTVASPALRGAWLRELLDAAGPTSTIVMLTPGVDDNARVRAYVSEERLVRGMISLIAYQAPLPGETRFEDSGVAFWFPPMAPSPFAGSRAMDVVRALKTGGQPAARVDELTTQSALGTATLMPLLLALEHADWSWRAFRRGPHMHDAADGIREATTIACAAAHVPVPATLGLVRPTTMRAVMWLARRILPLDIEVYLAFHFVKVGAQTREHVAHLIRAGQERNLPTATLQRLLAATPDEAGEARAVAARVFAAR